MSTLLTLSGLAVGLLLLACLRTPSPASGSAPATTVSVIVPARNEEASLPHLLASLRAQHRPAEVVVVDDGSTDATAEISTAAGVRVIRVVEPPPGWLGKPWACQVGADAASGDVLVFLDGDVVLAPDALARLVEAHRCTVPDGLLSVQPFHRTTDAYEQFSLYPNLLSMMATGHFTPIRALEVPMAFGPCVVTTATAYRAAGGHAAVRGEVLEDLRLGRAYSEAGRDVRCLGGGSTVSFRMYPQGWRQLVEGWTKNLAGGATSTRLLPFLLTVWWMTAASTAAIGGLGWVVGNLTARPTAWLPLLLFALAASQVTFLARQIGSFRWWVGPLFPVLLLGLVVLLARSALHRSLRREVTWRGRTIALGAHG